MLKLYLQFSLIFWKMLKLYTYKHFLVFIHINDVPGHH